VYVSYLHAQKAANDYEASEHSDMDSEDGLPPLERNMNRRVIVHDESDDETESDEG